MPRKNLVKWFPDIQWTLEETVIEGDVIAARFTMRGTHRGAIKRPFQDSIIRDFLDINIPRFCTWKSYRKCHPSATVSVTEPGRSSTVNLGLSSTLSGDVDWVVGTDWSRRGAVVHYTPEHVSSGRLAVEYRLR